MKLIWSRERGGRCLEWDCIVCNMQSVKKRRQDRKDERIGERKVSGKDKEETGFQVDNVEDELKWSQTILIFPSRNFYQTL